MSKKVFSFYILFIVILFAFPLLLSSCSDGKSSYLYTAKKKDISRIVISCTSNPNSLISLNNKEHIEAFLDSFPNKKVKFIENKEQTVIDWKGGCEKIKLDKEVQFDVRYLITIISDDKEEHLEASDYYISIDNIDYERVLFKKNIFTYIKSIREDILKDRISNASTINSSTGDAGYPVLLEALKSSSVALEENSEYYDIYLDVNVSSSDYFYFDDDTIDRIYYYENGYYVVFDNHVCKIINLNYSLG